MGTHTTDSWFIIREPNELIMTQMNPSELATKERVWVGHGLTVIKVEGAKIVLVGSLDWIQQFIDVGDFNECRSS